MTLTGGNATQGDSTGGHSAAGEPSVSSAIEHLVASSQGVITKRIDLAMLEGRELLSRTLQGAVFVGLGMVVGAGAWFALVACLVSLVLPDANLTVRLAAFGLLNAGGTVGLLALANYGRLPTPASPEKDGSRATEEP